MSEQSKDFMRSTLAAISHMSHEELQDVVDAVQMRRAFLAKKAVRSFVVGDRVKFDGRNGPVVGEITKVNRKNLVVRSLNCGTKWRVPGHMVSPALGIGV